MTFLSNQTTRATTTAQDTYLGGGEKTAVLGTALLSALGGHFSTNIAGRAAHHGSNLAEIMAHKGFQHGLLGQQVHPARHLSIKSLLGPESMVTYEAARKAGEAAVKHAPNPVEREAYLRGLHGMAASQPNLQHAPIIDPITKAVHHELAGTAPQVQAQGFLSKGYSHLVDQLTNHVQTGFETGAQKAVGMLRGAAPTLAAAAAEPIPMAGHFAVNLGRELAGRSSVGQRFIRNEIAAGLRGEMHGPVKSLAYDIGASPALLDARKAMNQARHSMPPEMASYVADNIHKIEKPEVHIQNLLAPKP